MRIRSSRAALGLVVIAGVGLCAPSPAGASAPYSVTPISGPGATIQQTEALNGSGAAVGKAQFGGAGPQDCGFLWQAGALTELAPVTNGTGGHVGCAGAGSGDDTAWAINAAGLIAGTSGTQAVTWQGAARPTSLGSTGCTYAGVGGAPGAPGGSQALAINDRGTAAGTSNTTCATPSVLDAWVGSPSQVIAAGSPNAGGKGDAQAMAINNAGQAVVYYDGAGTSGTRPSAALYPGLIPLPLVPAIIARGHSARAGPGALNDSGVVVGAIAAAPRIHAGYSQNGGAAVTLVPANGTTDATASAVNNGGDVVGSSFSGSSASVATIWPAAAPPAAAPAPTGTDLNTLIPANAGIALETAVAINSSGQILAEGSQAGTSQWVLLTPPATGITISSGNPVPEPASGTVNTATFTITLPQAATTAVTITYKTIDGTATAANNDYTAVPNGSDSGSVTIPAGQASVPIQVQVDAGSGNSTSETKGFQVQLKSSSGPPISTTAGSAPQTITVPGITGTLTDGVFAQAGSLVTLTGTASTGQAVTQNTTTDADGRYQFYADPGAYTITPVPPAAGRGNSAYDAVNCPGTVQPGSCANISLAPSANLTADFKVVSLVVNSTALTQDSAQAAQGLCDVTPNASQATCTLPQAIDISDRYSGKVIGFDIPGGGVPVINVPGGGGLPEAITAPTVIDGTTQPGGRVEIAGSGKSQGEDAGLLVGTGGDGSTIRGMVIHGFRYQIHLNGISGHDVTVQGNWLGVDAAGNDAPNPQLGFQDGIYLLGNSHDTVGGSQPGQGNVISGNRTYGIQEAFSGGFDVIQGNVIGKQKGKLVDGQELSLDGAHDTIGGSTPSPGTGAGNDIVGSVSLGPSSVFQGNAVIGGILTGSDDTIGGATAAPGTGVGNLFVGAGLSLKGGDVVQGNYMDASALQVFGNSNTIGGGRADLGNRIRHGDVGAIRLEGAPDKGPDHNVIENNRIDHNAGAGVAVESGTGNSIFANEMTANTLGISLGPGPFLYNGDKRFGSGPNNYQPYPLLFSSHRKGGRVLLSGKLIAGLGESYSVELYSQPRCAKDSITPGQGEHYLGRQGGLVTDRLTGDVTFKLAVTPAPGNHAITATATGPDGSTSEFSPCLTIGHTAPSFTGTGVQVDDGAINVQSPARSSFLENLADLVASAAKAKPTHARAPTASVHPFCPPITTRACTGTITLRTRASHRQRSITVAHLRFKLAPGELATIEFRLPTPVLRQLRRTHRLEALATATAHDGAKHRRRTVRRLVLRYRAP